jgi:hypothetical protein
MTTPLPRWARLLYPCSLPERYSCTLHVNSLESPLLLQHKKLYKLAPSSNHADVEMQVAVLLINELVDVKALSSYSMIECSESCIFVSKISAN